MTFFGILTASDYVVNFHAAIFMTNSDKCNKDGVTPCQHSAAEAV